ncbi:hypothetical protein EVAR_53706_1 [Eumeta japonica]|uniref:Uncharacterized protein n=1 Tax=Eumeta variegata TaxID=151549 RepID=A0A4C1Z262_EUMVA|nr:hypothetical protein EVAR_53706_1 [Eumeta japonica]
MHYLKRFALRGVRRSRQTRIPRRLRSANGSPDVIARDLLNGGVCADQRRRQYTCGWGDRTFASDDAIASISTLDCIDIDNMQTPQLLNWAAARARRRTLHSAHGYFNSTRALPPATLAPPPGDAPVFTYLRSCH